MPHNHEALVGLSELMDKRHGVLVHLQFHFWGGRDRQIPGPCWPGSLAYLVLLCDLSSHKDLVSYNIMKNLKSCVGHHTDTHMHVYAPSDIYTHMCMHKHAHTTTIIYSHWLNTNIIYELYLNISAFIYYIVEQHTF